MKNFPFIDKFSYVVAGGTFLACFFIFYKDTGEFVGSFTAAIMAAGLAWGTYLILRWLLLANHR
jgi:hypothetical protein